MKKLLSILEDERIPLNVCYNNFIIEDERTLLIKKTNDSFSSTIQTRELVDLYEVFTNEKDVTVSLLVNGDIQIKKMV